MALTISEISQLYVVVYDRAAESEGANYWKNISESQNKGMAAIANDMLATPASQAYFAGKDSNKDFVEHIYKNALGKDYSQDKAGIDYWVGQLASSTRGDVVANIIYAALNSDFTGDADAIKAQNLLKNEVAISNYTATNGNDARNAAGEIDQDWYHNLLKSVDNTPESLNAAKTDADVKLGVNTEWVSTSADAGNVYDLTVETDVASASTFNANMVWTSNQGDRLLSLQDEDELVGTAGRTDNTLNVTMGQANADEGDPTVRTPNATNVQYLNVKQTGNINELDLRLMKDIDKISVDQVTAAASNTMDLTTISNVLSGLRLKNVAKPETTISADFKAGVLSGADTLDFFLDNVEMKSFQQTSSSGNEGYEQVNVVTHNGVKAEDITFNQLENLTVNGDGSLEVYKLDQFNPLVQKGIADIYGVGGFHTVNSKTGAIQNLNLENFNGTTKLDITDAITPGDSAASSGVIGSGQVIGSANADTFITATSNSEKTQVDAGAGKDTLISTKSLADQGAGNENAFGKSDSNWDDQFKNIENLELRAQDGGVDLTADLSLFDDALETITLRNENGLLTDGVDFTLNDFDGNVKKVVLEHKSADGQTSRLKADDIKGILAEEFGANTDKVIVRTTENVKEFTLEVNPSKNLDAAYNYSLDVKGEKDIPNITINDNDQESNAVQIKNQDKAAEKTLTLNGGSAGNLYVVRGDGAISPYTSLAFATINAKDQKSDLRMVIGDDSTGDLTKQTVSLGSGNDIITVKKVDDLGEKTITDNGGNDILRAAFSKDAKLSLAGIEELHTIAEDSLALDVSGASVNKLLVMSNEAYSQTDVDVNGENGFGATAITDIISKQLELNGANITEVTLAGDLDDNDDDTNDEATTQNFNGISTDSSASKLTININSELDFIKEGAVAYNVGQITANKVGAIDIKVADEKDGDTVTTFKGVNSETAETISFSTKGSIVVPTIEGNVPAPKLKLLDVTNVARDFSAGSATAPVLVFNMADNSVVELGDANGELGKLVDVNNSAGDKITINAGAGKFAILGNSKDTFVNVAGSKDTVATIYSNNASTKNSTTLGSGTYKLIGGARADHVEMNGEGILNFFDGYSYDFASDTETSLAAGTISVDTENTVTVKNGAVANINAVDSTGAVKALGSFGATNGHKLDVAFKDGKISALSFDGKSTNQDSKQIFEDGVSIAANGGVFDYAVAGGTYSATDVSQADATKGLTVISNTTAAIANLETGAGDDLIIINKAGASAAVEVKTGAGNDSFVVNNNALTVKEISLGKGADTLTANEAITANYKVEAGESNTFGSHDVVKFNNIANISALTFTNKAGVSGPAADNNLVINASNAGVDEVLYSVNYTSGSVTAEDGNSAAYFITTNDVSAIISAIQGDANVVENEAVLIKVDGDANGDYASEADYSVLYVKGATADADVVVEIDTGADTNTAVIGTQVLVG